MAPHPTSVCFSIGAQRARFSAPFAWFETRSRALQGALPAIDNGHDGCSRHDARLPARRIRIRWRSHILADSRRKEDERRAQIPLVEDHSDKFGEKSAESLARV